VLTIHVSFKQTKLISNFESEINAKEIDIELIQKQMTGQVEKRPESVPRGYSTVRSLKNS
jgi:hypothetical protein